MTPVIGEVLSPSQVKKFMDCPAKWWFHYGLGMIEPPNGNLSIGKTVHSAMAENFRNKIEDKRDLPVTSIQALCRDAWKVATEDAIFRDDEDPQQLGLSAELLAVKYLEEAAPHIEPQAVEVPVEGEIGGVKVRGIVDLIDVNGCVIDIKTSCKKPSGVDQMHRFQVSTYRRLMPTIRGEARVDTLVKTKTLQLIQQPFDVGESDLAAVESLYPLAQASMRTGYYMPNRTSMMCSRRNCSYWRCCEKEYGGTVEET